MTRYALRTLAALAFLLLLASACDSDEKPSDSTSAEEFAGQPGLVQGGAEPAAGSLLSEPNLSRAIESTETATQGAASATSDAPPPGSGTTVPVPAPALATADFLGDVLPPLDDAIIKEAIRALDADPLPLAIDLPGFMPPATLAAKFAWALPPRYDDSWDHHVVLDTYTGPDGDTIEVWGYDPAFVHPSGWTPYLNGCLSTSPDKIVTYDWAIRRGGIEIDHFTKDECDVQSGSFTLPEPGLYEVSLTVALASGETATSVRTIDVRDRLIASLGDSAAAGEGNPEARFDGTSPFPTYWEFTPCHRSAASGHARAAEALETAEKPVTFLAFGCSGAEIGTGILGPYDGIEPGDNLIAPQVEGLARTLCADPSLPAGECPASLMRKLDVLMLQVGVNDVQFSTIFMLCANVPSEFLSLQTLEYAVRSLLDQIPGLGEVLDFFGADDACDENQGLNHLFEWFLGQLRSGVANGSSNSYGDIREALEAYGVQADQVILIPYPTPFGIPVRAGGSFQGVACGVLRLIEHDEAEWLTDLALRLNQLIETEAVRNGWWAVPYAGRSSSGQPTGIVNHFADHGYCDGVLSYFRSVSESLLSQGDKNGSMHPNATGHARIADTILATIAARKPNRNDDTQMHVFLDSLRLTGNLPGYIPEAIGPDGTVELDLHLSAHPYEALPWADPTRLEEYARLGQSGGLENPMAAVIRKGVKASATVRVTPDAWSALPPELSFTLRLAPTDESWAFGLLALKPRSDGLGLIRAPLPFETPFDTEPGDTVKPCEYYSCTSLTVSGGGSRVGDEHGLYGTGQRKAGPQPSSTVPQIELRYCIYAGDIPRVPFPGPTVAVDVCWVEAYDGSGEEPENPFEPFQNPHQIPDPGTVIGN